MASLDQGALPCCLLSLINEQEGLRDRWAKNLSTSLNRPFTVEQAALPEQVSQQPVMERLDQPPTIDDVKKAISATNSNRAPGKAAGPKALEAFHDVLQNIWSEEDMAEDFHKPLIVAPYKRKGKKSFWGNCQGHVTSFRKRKIFARNLLNCLRVSKRSLPEEQCG